MSCKIGVDGGGTKTECILVDAAGAVAARHTAPGCNPSVVGPETARAVLTAALQAVRALSGRPVEITATLLCLAGNQSFWRETAAGLSGFGRVETGPDSLPVLELATGGAPGLAVHAGTGSFVAVRAPDGSAHYAGGLGWRFGDPGSGYDLGRRAVARALLELQSQTREAEDRRPGTGKMSLLAVALREHTSRSEYGAISRYFYTAAAANARIAAFAPRVIELAERGDAAARQVIAESINELAALVDGMLQRHFPALRLPPASDQRRTGPGPASMLPLGVSGPLLNRPPCLSALRACAAARAWPVRLQAVADPPIEGVRRLLLKMG